MRRKKAIEQTVFIIDDNPAVLQTLACLIEANGLKAKTFIKAEDFLAFFQGQPGCLVLNIRMPRMTGFALHDLLKRRGCSLPIIYITTHENNNLTAQTAKHGDFYLLTKPINDDILIKTLVDALRTDCMNRANLTH